MAGLQVSGGSTPLAMTSPPVLSRLTPPPPSLDDHIQDILEFVSRHQWVYDIQLTQFYQLNWWTKIPQEWREPLSQLTTEELNNLPYGLTKATWPEGLQTYIRDSLRLSLCRTPPPWVVEHEVNVNKQIRRGMTPKKLHEVSRVAGVVAGICADTRCQLVLDVGSGLGYLGHCLSQQCRISVVGLEREEQRVETAGQKRGVAGVSCDRDTTRNPCTEFSHDLSTPQHVSVQLNIDISQRTTGSLQELLARVSLDTCLTGLHCCGDLTPVALHLLHSLPHTSLKTSVIVGCCYHKMTEGSEVEGSEFRHFPMSSLVRSVLHQVRRERSRFVINVLAMRLAAQETRERWRHQSSCDHMTHMKKVAFRAMLEAVAKQPIPRQALRNLDCQTFHEYAMQASHNLQAPELLQDSLEYYSINKDYMTYIEPFTALQVCMQGVLESLVLLDRLVCLREWGMMAELVPLFDKRLSPRNMAILVHSLSGNGQ